MFFVCFYDWLFCHENKRQFWFSIERNHLIWFSGDTFGIVFAKCILRFNYYFYTESFIFGVCINPFFFILFIMMRNFNGCPNICHCHQRNIDSINLGQKKSIQEKKKRVDLHNYPFTMCSSVLLMMLIWNVLPVILL